jgi:hypothetical protein
VSSVDAGTVAYAFVVRLDEGTEVDVALDESFKVLSTDDDGPNDDNDNDD